MYSSQILTASFDCSLSLVVLCLCPSCWVNLGRHVLFFFGMFFLNNFKPFTKRKHCTKKLSLETECIFLNTGSSLKLDFFFRVVAFALGVAFFLGQTFALALALAALAVLLPFLEFFFSATLEVFFASTLALAEGLRLGVGPLRTLEAAVGVVFLLGRGCCSSGFSMAISDPDPEEISPPIIVSLTSPPIIVSSASPPISVSLTSPSIIAGSCQARKNRTYWPCDQYLHKPQRERNIWRESQPQPHPHQLWLKNISRLFEGSFGAVWGHVWRLFQNCSEVMCASSTNKARGSRTEEPSCWSRRRATLGMNKMGWLWGASDCFYFGI